MPTITLVATDHKEKGLCNAKELLKIIEQIRPDVIFEEIPPLKFEEVYAGTRRASLEVKAIKEYLQKYPGVHHYPVDLDIEQAIEKEIEMEVAGIPLICSHSNEEYYYLSVLLSSWLEKHGFPYLNSDKCSELILRKKVLEKQVLDALKTDKNQTAIDHERLSLAYKQWLDQHDERENVMLRNIYSYMEQKKYESALFLVGAAHRKPIMHKVKKYEAKESFKLNWVFYS